MKLKTLLFKPFQKNTPWEIQLTFGVLIILWLVHVANMLTGLSLNQFGIIPRTTSGLTGILTAPLLHGGWWHLIGNSLPLLVLGFFASEYGKSTYIKLMSFVWLIGGSLVWIFGSLMSEGQTTHIGFSGVLFGMWAFLIATGFLERSLKSIIIAALTTLFYSGMFFSFFQYQPQVSMSGHLLGALSGVAFAFLRVKTKGIK